jgi:carbamoylphosphate synthase large subunit
MKKNILISAGGTATGWHLASLVSEKFASYFNLFVCDINPPHLIPAARLAQRFFQVPLAASPDYHSHMLEIFAANKIEVFVPLVDADDSRFASDSAELAALGVRTTAVSSATSAIIGSKRNLSVFLESRSLRTPKTVSTEEVAKQTCGRFFIKPERGLGSKGAHEAESDEVLRAIAQDPTLLVQELCREPEITVEVFNHGGVLSLCRERLETKAGVCTKARIFEDSAMQTLAERLCSALDLPLAFCFQVMTGADGEFLITDVNPRLGAGTALSTAYGWSLASAALACWGDLPLDPRRFLKTSPGSRYVVRVYKEVVMDK